MRAATVALYWDMEMAGERSTSERLLCRGRMHRATAPFQVTRGGYHLTFDAVPAWVCRQCGEPYFETPQVETIQAAIQAVDDKARLLTVAG
jgi:YgiT-type zinc finger domain-containing protein